METEKKNSVGRPSKYKKEYCQQMIDFFLVPISTRMDKQTVSAGKNVHSQEEESSELPMFMDFAIEIGVCFDTLNEWTSKHQDFSEAYKKCKKIQERIIVKNGIKGRYNTTMSIFMLKCNHGYRETQQVEHSGQINLNVDKDDLEL